MKQVFLHIGSHKTGSSSLQFFLHKNRKVLASLGYIYPFQEQAQHNLSFILKQDIRANNSLGTWEDLEKEIDSSDCDNIIISSEGFFTENKKQNICQKVADLLGKYRVKIVIYLRRQDLKIESFLSQQIKTGTYVGDIRDFIDTTKFERMSNYLQVLDEWSNYFGQENIIVRPLERQKITNIYQDFLENIGIDRFDLFAKTQDQNIKPNLAQLTALSFMSQEIVRHLDLKMHPRGCYSLEINPQVKFVANFLTPFLARTKHWVSKDKYNLIPYDIAARILSTCEAQNSQIAKRYLKHENVILFEETLKKYEHDELELENLDRDYLVDTCSFLIDKIMTVSAIQSRAEYLNRSKQV